MAVENTLSNDLRSTFDDCLRMFWIATYPMCGEVTQIRQIFSPKLPTRMVFEYKVHIHECYTIKLSAIVVVIC